MREAIRSPADERSHPSAVTLIIVPDPDASPASFLPLFGRSPLERTVALARECNIGRVVAIPGLRSHVELCPLVAVGEPMQGAVVVVYEGAVVHSRLIQWFASAPVLDDACLVYDSKGRPAVWYGYGRILVPPRMPAAEELVWPRGLDSGHVARVVESDDLPGALTVVARELPGFPAHPNWQARASMTVLSHLCASPVRVAQWESGTIVAGLIGAAVGAQGPGILTALGAGLIVLAMTISLHLPAMARLLGEGLSEGTRPSAEHRASTGPSPRGSGSDSPRDGAAGVAPPAEARWRPGRELTEAGRGLVHAAWAMSTAHAWIAGAGSASLVDLKLADLIILLTSALASGLELARSRAVLRGTGFGRGLARPRLDAFARRLGVRPRTPIRDVPLIELSAAVGVWLAVPAWTWAVLVTTGIARLWGWLTEPPDQSSHGSHGE